jgi:hypothetical protein
LAGILEIEVYFSYLDRIGLLKMCLSSNWYRYFPVSFRELLRALVLLCMGYIPACVFCKLIFFHLFSSRLCMKY